MRRHGLLELRKTAAAAVLGALAVTAPGLEREAQACGGCFAPPGENDSVVTDHRMILSVSSTQTTLWDQIEYSGSPSTFAWVLPVSDSKVATLGLSADVVFSSLDRLTQTTVQQPPLNCPAPPSDCQYGGGLSASADAGAAFPAPPGVDVNKHEVVGPYVTDFLHSTDPNALNQWLTDHGYAVPADVQPVIAAYVAAHYDFIAMKLVPGTNVQAMRPVRVTTPGAAPVLPLRMVAAGTGPIVSITLWVMGDGRWDPSNFPFFTIASSDLTWDWSQGSSDYTTVRAAKNAAAKNGAWELESSLPISSAQLTTLIDNGGRSFGGPFGLDAGSDYAPIDPSDAGPDGGYDPGETADQVRQEDLQTLFAGIDQNNLRVTRIRADLAHASLASDLVLQAAADQSPVSNIRLPTKELSEPQCPVYDGCTVVGNEPRGQAQADTNANTALHYYLGTEVSIDCGRSCGISSAGTQIAMLRACRGVRRIKPRRSSSMTIR